LTKSIPNKRKKENMKKLQLAILAAGLAGAMSASATIYSDTAFGTMSSYNGTYVPGSPGYEHWPMPVRVSTRWLASKARLGH